jgi:hypothetical protein
MHRMDLPWFLACAMVAVACSGRRQEPRESLGRVSHAVGAPLATAYCTVAVTGKGTKEMEADYLPHVITCENGGANLQALKAQAIAARSVAYYAMATEGSICDGQGCQVYGCGATPSEKAKQAVMETSGVYLSYGGMLTYGFYVDGDPKTSPPECHGSSSWPTEKYVTYNQGKSGNDVEQTSLGFIGRPGFGQNRGCMAQWGARCLENSNGKSKDDILHFYYGEDIEQLQAPGDCVTEFDEDKDGVADAADNCVTVKNSRQTDSDEDGEGDACDGDDDDDGIADEKDNCAKTKNEAQTDSDEDGKGDACDDDDDNDGIADLDDNCPNFANGAQDDANGDGTGDACEDQDHDGIIDAKDRCPEDAAASQFDRDEDGLGDDCDPDDDGDGVSDTIDNCPTVANPEQDIEVCDDSAMSCAVAPACAQRRSAQCFAVVVAALAVGAARRRRFGCESAPPSAA